MNRREFILGTTGFTITPSILSAQTPAIPASTVSKDEIFADFESGTFDGWTLSGNCWTKESHDATTIPGITGFQGKRFLCTLHPKLGNNATGKAISREFTIEKPFINFLIGGGNYPGETCLNLVVDGKIMRTETGNNSSELIQKSWDVSQLVGKKARFEVVDISKSTERGYVMVDEIRYATPHTKEVREAWNNASSWTDHDGKTLLLTEQQLHFFNSVNNICGDLSFLPEKSFGISEGQLRQCMLRVSQRVIEPDLDHVPMEDAALLSRKIADGIDNDVIPYLFKNLNIHSNENLMAFLHYQSIIDYMRTHAWFDSHNAQHLERYQYVDSGNDKRAGVQGFIDQDELITICGPLNWAACELSALGGYSNMLKIEGFVRQSGNAILPPADNIAPWHSWVSLRLPDGSICHADPTIARINLKVARKRNGFIFNPHSLPLSRWERGLFIATHWANRSPVIGVIKNSENVKRLWTAKFFSREETSIGTYNIEYTAWKKLQSNLSGPFLDYFYKDAQAAEK